MDQGPRTKDQGLTRQGSELTTHNPQLGTQASGVRTHNPELGTHDSQLRLCNRARIPATHLASWRRHCNHSLVTGKGRRNLSRGGKSRPHRRTMSSSDQPLVTWPINDSPRQRGCDGTLAPIFAENRTLKT
jgi:hypothetical protein